jgi:uncharacterized spore protein YtfJ
VAKPEPKRPKRPPIERLLDRVTGARLCYGEAVTSGDVTVIPVSRVRLSGGFGFGGGSGGGDEGGGSGGGGGGHLDASPLGFIEVGPAGTRYHQIPDPERAQQMLRAGAAAIATVAAGLAGARRLRGSRRGRRARGLLNA